MVNNKIGRIGEFQDLFNEKIYIYILFLWYIDLPYMKFKIKIDKFVLFFFEKKLISFFLWLWFTLFVKITRIMHLIPKFLIFGYM